MRAVIIQGFLSLDTKFGNRRCYIRAIGINDYFARPWHYHQIHILHGNGAQ